MRIVFFGTPEFAVPTLDRLFGSSHRVVGVVSQPDRPRGRGQQVTPSPVKRRADGHAPIFQPTRLKDEEFLGAVRALEPDLGVVAAYGRILPQVLLDLPRLGMINVHASLLPRWRGAAPVHRAVIAGDKETGVTIMRVVLALDAGAMLRKVTSPIGSDETSADVEPRLATLGASLLVDVVDALATGPIPEEAQDESLVTYAARLERRESQIDWTRSAAEIHNRIRGLQPWPLAAAMLNGKRTALLRSEVAEGASFPDAAPGTVTAVQADAIVVVTGAGALRITEVQVEGRPPMAMRAYLNGRRVNAGDRLAPLPEAP